MQTEFSIVILRFYRKITNRARWRGKNLSAMVCYLLKYGTVNIEESLEVYFYIARLKIFGD